MATCPEFDTRVYGAGSGAHAAGLLTVRAKALAELPKEIEEIIGDGFAQRIVID